MPAPEAEVSGARIALLPPEVAEGIAAGEVIDRPAAVVKELIENSIDAGARRIEVRVEAAGQQLIEVVDDGQGMPATDMRLAFQRHATSKLRSLADLNRLTTLGFRGEALASIAAVSRVEGVSRPRDGGEGYRVVIEAGIVAVARTSSGPPGTRMEVRRLFFNTPARLKFLRQPATENAVIARLVADLALGHPEIGFRLLVEGRVGLETPGTGDLPAAVAAIYDAETAAAMLPVEAPAVQGLISPPAMHRGTRDHIVILLNGRRIQHRNLAFAVEQAYRGLREPDRFPIAVLNLHMDPADVDVNVHPTKREVRFRHEGAVFALLERACYHALRQSPLYEAETPIESSLLQLRETAVNSAIYPAPNAEQQRPPAHGVAAVSMPEQAASRLPSLSYVGQLLAGYLIAEAPDAAVLIDQHAAHERVLYEEALRRLEERSPASQVLLVPALLDLTPLQLDAFQAHRGWLATLGFEAEPFGPHTLRLLASPVDLPGAKAGRLLEQLLTDLAGERRPDRRLPQMAALIACHSAIRFGDPIAPETARQLLTSLAKTADPISCPHGRPTTVILPEAQLRRLFKRP